MINFKQSIKNGATDEEILEACKEELKSAHKSIAEEKNKKRIHFTNEILDYCVSIGIISLEEANNQTESVYEALLDLEEAAKEPIDIVSFLF